MFRCVLVFGLLGPVALIGGCASGPTGDSSASDTPAASSTSQPTERTEAGKAPQTKQVTLSVSGMT